VENNKFVVILARELKTTNFIDTFQCDIAKYGYFEKLIEQSETKKQGRRYSFMKKGNDICPEDVA
jgi:hypothetical protein